MKKILFIAIALIASLTIAAQTNDEATLTVSGSAENEEKATLVALRSAIEQTYGAFVSANTTILNDDLVKDEIVSISAGNIKNYKKLSSIALSNGQISVTLSATVSIGKLINYAQSKGATTEFAGATFAMNIKLMELREKNTLEALCNMWQTVSELSKNAFDYKIEVGQPTIAKRKLWASESKMLAEEQGYYVPIEVTALANEYTTQIEELVKNTYQSLRLTQSEIKEWIKLQKNPYRLRPLPITTDNNATKYCNEGLKAFKNIYNSLFNFVIEENSGENITYVVHKGDNKYIRTDINHENPYSSYKADEFHKLRYHIVDNKGIIHSSLSEFYPGCYDGRPSFYDYLRNGNKNNNRRGYLWCGGFLACRGCDAPGYDAGKIDGDALRFDVNDWMLPVKTTKTPKVLESALEKDLQKQYKKAIKKGDKNAINKLEGQLYDYVTTYDKVEQPLHKISFKVFIPSDRMNQLKGFTVRKNL